MKDLKFTPGKWETVDYAGYWLIQDGQCYDDIDLLNEEK